MDFFIITIVLIILLIATITDIRSREVPDFLNYAAIATGIGIHVLDAVLSESYLPLISTGAGLAVGMVIGFGMYYAGQWGGGDAKLIMGIGALIGLDLFAHPSLFNLPPLALYVVNLVIAGTIYGLTWTVIMAAKHKSRLSHEWTKRLGQLRKMRISMYVLVAALLIAALITKLLVLLLAGALIFVFFYLWVLTTCIERACMIKKIPLDKLTEGDWVAEDVIIRGKRICGPKDLGLTKDQLLLLTKHKVKDVVVKEGIPFVPSFLLAYFLMIFGNWFLYLL